VCFPPAASGRPAKVLQPRSPLDLAPEGGVGEAPPAWTNLRLRSSFRNRLTPRFDQPRTRARERDPRSATIWSKRSVGQGWLLHAGDMMPFTFRGALWPQTKRGSQIRDQISVDRRPEIWSGQQIHHVWNASRLAPRSASQYNGAAPFRFAMRSLSLPLDPFGDRLDPTAHVAKPVRASTGRTTSSWRVGEYVAHNMYLLDWRHLRLGRVWEIVARVNHRGEVVTKRFSYCGRCKCAEPGT
jgi:hypothetical protein